MFGLLLLTIVFAVLTQLLIPSTKAKAGSFDDFNFPTIEDGTPIYYIAGQLKIDGSNLLWYGDFSTKAIKKKTGLFSKSTVGYKYYLGWQLGVCLGGGGGSDDGGNVILKKIWFGTSDPGWTGEADDYNYNIHMKDDSAFGGDTSGGGYDLQCTWYNGSGLQNADSYLEDKIGSLVPAWRGMAYLVMHGYIGNSTNLNTVSLEVQRIPDPLGLGAEALIGTEGDVNPANVLYEILSSDWGCLDIDPARLRTSSFVGAGHTLYAEDEGISCGFSGSGNAAKNAIQDILAQIDAGLYEDPVDGMIDLKLIRQDYDVNDIFILDESNVEKMSSYSINLWGDTKNKVRVQFTDRSRDYKSDAVSVAQDLSNINFQGSVKPMSSQYPHIKRAAHADRKATRDLDIYSTPIANISLTALRKDITLRPGTALVLNYPIYEISNLVLRVKKVNLGDIATNSLTLDLVSDKYAKALSIFGAPAPTPTTGPSLSAITVAVSRTIEAPYFFVANQSVAVDNPDAPFVMTLPKRPNDAQTGFDVYAKTDSETTYDEINVDSAYPAYGALYSSYPLSYAYDDLTGLELSTLDDPDILVEASADQISTTGQNLIMIDDEIMGFETFLTNGSGRLVLKGVHRALLDTVPAAHAAGARVVWLEFDAVGSRQFTEGDTIDVVVASKAPRGAQDETNGLDMTVPEVI